MVEKQETHNFEQPHIPVPMETLDVRSSVDRVLSDSTDVSLWQQGAKMYRQFLSMIGDADLRGRYAADDELQLIFLGEKPAIWGSPERFTPVQNELARFGLIIDENFLFNPVAVDGIARQYPNEFAELPTENAAALIRSMNAAGIRKRFVERGLLLGYPLSACREFASARNANEIDRQNPKVGLRGLRGMEWVDYSGSLESQEKEQRIRRAYEVSGL